MELPNASHRGKSRIATAIRIAEGRYQRGRTLRNRAAMVVRRKRRNPTVGEVSERAFDDVLDVYADADTVFVHVGLRDLRRAFDRDPYAFLLGRLDDRFESVLNPGFTPSFRSVDGRVYHKRYSVPKFGAFSRLFLEDCEYRTDDPTNSILVKGPYRFPGCDHTDTWAEDGCFARLDRENARYLNVGTDWLRSSQIHYLESRLDVPYLETAAYEGVICREDGVHEEITHPSHEYTMPVTWNRPKIRNDLEQAGVLEEYDLNGLRVLAFRARDLREALTPLILEDPYYLVT
ncbi:AAC(3) family N-acetyltransferase [Halalkalicoccus tibetensis]|uniref:AAC(3) family N-acetyltransferase n=1 Tax=Halalkalicoccus tibetensis TaxID=175632 RepID=A0ABD5UXV8_9EURY